jgi:hypothetical protein
MKNASAFSLVAILSIATLSCKSDSTGSNDTSFSGRGADYFPVKGTDLVSARFTGAMTWYDISGAITERDNIDQDRTAFVSGTTMRSGLPFFSVLGYDDFGNPSGGPDVFLSNTNDKVLAVGRRDAPGTVLPAQLSVGTTWNPDPHGSPSYKATVKEHLGSYTNSRGNAYSDVIRIEASWIDSTTTDYGWTVSTHVIDAAGTIYFAKGVGPVEVRIDRFNEHGYNKTSGNITDYARQTMGGTASRNK